MQHPWKLALLPVAALGPAHCFAVEYMSVEQAQQAMFPSATSFTSRPMLLTESQREAIARASDTKVNSAQLRLWEARDAQGVVGHVIVDEVLGKHDLITYAVGLLPGGKVKQVEILIYRETHGGQIRNAAWRTQFNGRGSQDPLRIDQDIQNISGATLSCVHVTNGIRRILATYEAVIREPGDKAGVKGSPPR